jgi:hypothetical protein
MLYFCEKSFVIFLFTFFTKMHFSFNFIFFSKYKVLFFIFFKIKNRLVHYVRKEAFFCIERKVISKKIQLKILCLSFKHVKFQKYEPLLENPLIFLRF